MKIKKAKGKDENNIPDGICAICGKPIDVVGHRLSRRGLCGCSYWSFNPIVGKWVRGVSFNLVGDHE